VTKEGTKFLFFGGAAVKLSIMVHKIVIDSLGLVITHLEDTRTTSLPHSAYKLK
jgi:hypothetical protein